MHAKNQFRTQFDRLRRYCEERADQALTMAYRQLSPPPATPVFDGEARFAFVTVNFSTSRWLALSLLSLSEQESLGCINDIVIVDNGSRDGGRLLIRELATKIPRITLIENNHLLSHARGMRLGIKKLDTLNSRANVILSVDTDVIFLRPDTLGELSRIFEQGAAFAGEMRHGIFEIPEAQASFIAVRRDVYARKQIAPWVNHGSPSYWMQKASAMPDCRYLTFPAIVRAMRYIEGARASWLQRHFTLKHPTPLFPIISLTSWAIRTAKHCGPPWKIAGVRFSNPMHRML